MSDAHAVAQDQLRSSASQSSASAPARRSWRMSWMRLQGQLLSRRQALKLSQPQLADRLGISLATMKRWESGHVTPSAMNLFQWADALGIEITSTIAAGVTSDTEEGAR